MEASRLSLQSSVSLWWPGVAQAQVVVGGVAVTCEQALAASATLAASRTSAIGPVLRAAGHPLAGCDYHRAAAPYLERVRAQPKTGRAGAAGRHVTKQAFQLAIAAACAVARAAEVARALGAFSTDERYAVAMAREAVTIRERAHAARLRAQVREAIGGAVTRCSATPGLACSRETACGTGSCPFAPPHLASLEAAAGPGRLIRPPGHAQAGQGFSGGPALAALLEAEPYEVAVVVTDADTVHAEDAVVAA